jgi:predicted DNA-binding protein (MmcQ/YjbR family)
MNRDRAHAVCGNHPGAVEGFPFGDDVAVFKVGGKIFAMVSLSDRPAQVSLKCDPDLAVELRSRYDAVAAGYHLNKTHWNTVTLNGSIPTDEVAEMIDDSYRLVVGTLRRADREKLARLAKALH